MEEQQIERALYEQAAALIARRYPSGWGGAAALRLADGRILTSVAIDTENASACLCIETGAICEAHKYNARVTHCLCLVRDDENSPLKVLSPCGICQERLRYWGPELLVAVTLPQGGLRFVPLGALQPYHWSGAYPAAEQAHWQP